MAEMEPQRDEPQSWFAFAGDWLVLETYFRHAARIPANAREFHIRYGEFADQAPVAAFLSALAGVDRIASAFGTPDSLKRRIGLDPNVLTGSSAPHEVYAQLVWLANRAQSVAAALQHGLTELQRGGGPERAAMAQAVLVRCAEEGVDFAAVIDALRKKIAAYRGPLGSAVTTVNGTDLVDEANQSIGAIEGAAERLMREPEQNDPKASGIDAVREELSSREAELGRKRLFTSDLNNLFAEGSLVTGAIHDLDTRLRMLGDFFADAANRLAEVARIASKEQLADPAWVGRAVDRNSLVCRAQTIQEAARRVTQSFFINSVSSAG